MDIRLKIIIAISIVSLILLAITWSVTNQLGQTDTIQKIEQAA